MSIACRNAQGLNLAQGICDMEVPAPVIAGAKKAMDDGLNIYTPTQGLDALREAIADKVGKFSHKRPDPDKEIIVSLGATGVFYCACLALLDPGDEVILPEPFYGYHRTTLEAAGGVPVFVPTQTGTWEMNPADLEKAITARTRGIVLCTPGNPSGHVMSQEEIDVVAAMAVKHDLIVFSDEIYEHFVFDGRKHISPASHPDLAERTVTMSGLSKTYSITGWRLGYTICPEHAATAMSHINDLVYVCPPSPLQMGAAAGLCELPEEYYLALSRDHEKKRDLFCNTLDKVGLEPYRPQGAYYVLADVSSIPGKDSLEKAMAILEKTGVAGVPGRAFYHDDSGDNLIRFCFAKEFDELEKACEKMLGL